MEVDIMKEIEKGRAGHNVGLNCGLPKLNKYINGVQKGWSYLLVAPPKAGKTALTDFIFVIQPYLNEVRKGKSVKWLYFTFEISAVEKVAKWIALLIYAGTLKKEETILWDSSYILSRGFNPEGDDLVLTNTLIAKYRVNISPKKPLIPQVNAHFEEMEAQDKVLISRLMKSHNFLNNEDLKVVQTIEERHIKPMLEHITFYETPENPTGIRKKILKNAEKYGTISTEKFVDDTGKEGHKIGSYELLPEHKDLHTIVIIDHVGLMSSERGFSPKEKIDKMSSYIVEIRNKLNYSPVMISHLNRSVSDPTRQKLAGQDLRIQNDDVKETGNLMQDITVAISLLNPSLYAHISNYNGMDLKKLPNPHELRTLEVMVNRNGEAPVSTNLRLIGATGFFFEVKDS